MKLLFAIVLLAACASATQAACPPGLDTAATRVTTNDVILIKSPLLSYNDAVTACQCFGEGWAIGNTTDIFDRHQSRSNQSNQARNDLGALLTANVPAPISVWFGSGAFSNICPAYDIAPGSTTSTGLTPCDLKKPAICARSKLVYNPVGSPCDNNLQVCARGGYCNAPPGGTGTGTCAVDNICYPNNPCMTGLANGYSSNKLDAYCTVNPSAPFGYTCECGLIQAPTNGPAPPTCAECPSANPCALIRCPAGSGCAYACGDYRGLRCETPDGTIVPSVTSSPSPTTAPPPAPPTGSQGVCGTGDATGFPTRCYFNNDPQGRYVCCDNQGCDGFAAPDNLFPRCKANGFAPPGYGNGATPPPPTPTPAPPSGDQGVCGSGAAGAFPTRCYFNNDPQGRYVCCDNQGCDGFNADNLTPHCKNYGYVPPNFGTGSSPPPPPTPPTGSQGVCGSGSAASFPTRCWFNNDPQGRYVCCDNDGCDGFAPPDFEFPRCKTNGYAPPGFGI